MKIKINKSYRLIAKNHQPLTTEEINILRTKKYKKYPEGIPDMITKCTHKEKKGDSSLIQTPDGKYKCLICGETFKFSNHTKEEVQKTVDEILDIIQTIKTIYLDGWPDAFNIPNIEDIKNLPELYELAVKNFNIYDTPYILVPPPNNYLTDFHQTDFHQNPTGYYSLEPMPIGSYMSFPQYPPQPEPLYNPYDLNNKKDNKDK